MNKRISIPVEASVLKALKLEALKRDMTLKQLVLDAVKGYCKKSLTHKKEGLE